MQPTDISGLLLWLKADSVTGHSDGDNSFTWNDSSGLGHHATSSGTTGPAWKTNVINGLPIFRFSGSNGFQLGATGSDESDFDLAVFTILIVARRTSGSGATVISKNALVANATRRKLQIGIAGTSLALSAGNDGSSISQSPVTTTDFNTYSVVARSNSDNDLNINGVINIKATTIDHTSFNNGRVEIGQAFSNGAERLTGDIAEIIVYDSALSFANRQAIEIYLFNKYGLTNGTTTSTSTTTTTSTSTSTTTTSTSTTTTSTSTSTSTSTTTTYPLGFTVDDQDMGANNLSGSSDLGMY